MKKILLLILLIPCVATAQVEISVLGGGSFVSGTYSGTADLKKTNISPYLSLKAAYIYKSLSFGISGDLITTKLSSNLTGANKKNNTIENVSYDWNAYKPGLNISLFANKHFNFSKSSVYAGINAGYIFSLSSSSGYSVSADDYILSPVVSSKGSSNGITFGLQFGYTYSVTDRLNIKAELAPRFLNSMNAFGDKDDKHVHNAIIVPLAVGLSLSL